MNLKWFFSIFIILTAACATSSESLKLWGEIEKKTRIHGKVVSQKKFAEVPSVLTPNSSEFQRLKVSDKEITRLELLYKSKTESKLKLKRSYEVKNGIVQELNFINFEKEVELSRPGLLTLQFFKNSTSFAKIEITLTRGD